MLSVAINVKNGAKYLARCLNSLSEFEDVVILDNYSNDETYSIAATYANVRLFQSEFCGMGKVRNQVATYAKYDWILCVDHDEILDPKLVQRLLEMQQKQEFIDYSIYKIRRCNYYDNFRVEAASWGNERIMRLYNRNQTKFSEENIVHDSFNMDGMTIREIDSGCMYHFPYDNISQLIDKMQFYSTLYARQHYLKKTPKLYNIPLRALMMFIKCYILKRGFMAGYEGLIISSYNAMGVFSKYIKLYELSYKRKIGLGSGIINTLSQLNQTIKHVNCQILLPHMVFMVIDDVILEAEQTSLEIINNTLSQNMVVPFKVSLINKNQNMATIINTFLAEYSDLAAIAWMASPNLLQNAKLFKRCKTALLEKKTIHGVNFSIQAE